MGERGWPADREECLTMATGLPCAVLSLGFSMAEPASSSDIIEQLLAHYQQPRHYGELADADLTYSGGIPDCGDTLTVYLKVAPDGRLTALQFTGQGCSVSIGAASLLIERLQGATIADLQALDEAAAVDLVGVEIAQARPRCATLAVSVLKAAARLARKPSAQA